MRDARVRKAEGVTVVRPVLRLHDMPVMVPLPTLVVRALSWVAFITVLILVPTLFLYGRSPQSGAPLFHAAAIVGGLASLPLLVRAGVSWRHAWPYATYAAVLLAIWALRPTEAAAAEIGRQGLFLLAICAAFVAVRRHDAGPVLLALHIASTALIVVQLAGPRSAIDPLGRAAFYHAVMQWSGYPEIGLLAAMAGAATAALALASPRWTLGLAAALLTVVFCAITVLVGSRSAMLTLAVVLPWLTAVAATRWRGRAATLGSLVIVAGVGWILLTGPGPVQIVQSAAATVSHEMQIRKKGWDAAWAMFTKHPLTGVGLGGYRGEYYARGLGLDATHAYNLVLHVAAETGLLGVVTYLLLWARASWRTLRASGRSRAGMAAFGVHALLLAFFVRSQSEHFLANLETSLRLLLLLGIVFGMAEGLSGTAEGRGAETRRVD